MSYYNDYEYDDESVTLEEAIDYIDGYLYEASKEEAEKYAKKSIKRYYSGSEQKRYPNGNGDKRYKKNDSKRC